MKESPPHAVGRVRREEARKSCETILLFSENPNGDLRLRFKRSCLADEAVDRAVTVGAKDFRPLSALDRLIGDVLIRPVPLFSRLPGARGRQANPNRRCREHRYQDAVSGLAG
jgi:hypothetical protein